MKKLQVQRASLLSLSVESECNYSDVGKEGLASWIAYAPHTWRRTQHTTNPFSSSAIKPISDESHSWLPSNPKLVLDGSRKSPQTNKTMAVLATDSLCGVTPVVSCCSRRKSLDSCFLGRKVKLTWKGKPQRLILGKKRKDLVCAQWDTFGLELILGVGVGLPCTVMECGDVVYRSTLPQSNGINITPPGVILAFLSASYLWATPGVAPGFWDMFVLAPLERFFRPSYRKDDFVFEKKLGEGAFGVVYKSSLTKKTRGKADALVVKKATEYGAVEIWMNERIRRACPTSCADFVHGFLESSTKGKEEAYWLVWRYEGDATLSDLMQSKDFPYNVEKMMLGEVENLPKGIERENIIIQTIMRQILFALDGLHSTGIVHRDIKPQNIIFSQESCSFKIIDLGAAADLRVGINYVPKEFLLDPRYAAPEQYIMSTQTPSAPPPPVAAALSPVLWQMNLPDRFDIYSAGLIFLQMAFPALRTDSSLIQFNRQLKRCGYDVVAWRESVEARASPELRRGFDLLDLDGGTGWEILLSMVRYKGRQRISAKGALAHPYFMRQGLLALSFMQNLKLQLIRATQQDYNETYEWIINRIAKSGTKTEGGFTEAELQELKEIRPKRKSTVPRNALASALRLQRKIIKTLDESLDEIKNRRKSFWWRRWIPRGE